MITRSELVAATLACACVLSAPSARADEPAGTEEPKDALDPLRERFRAGMESYRSGRYADAILVWEAIYRELGGAAGYRLAFNLGRAYDAYGDSTRAAEHYESYTLEVQKRRERGERVEPNVEKQEAEARERLDGLAATKGRIKVLAGERASLVQIDNGEPRASGFVAYVAPGAHRVVFSPGKDEVRREVQVRRGELVELSAPPVAPAPPAASAASVAPAAPRPPAAGSESRWETRTERPFAPVVLWIAGGVTVLSLVVPAVTYANALATKADYDGATIRADGERLASEYEDAKTTAYASLAAPGVCAAATAGLVAWWLLGTSESRVPVAPQAAAVRGGATFGLTGSF